MGKAVISDGYLTDIATAIREKNGSATTYRPKDMAAAIRAISGGGGLSYAPTGTMSAYDTLGTLLGEAGFDLDTSAVTSMANLFGSSEGHMTLDHVDLSKLDTSGVKNFQYMFGYCSKLTGLDLSGFDIGAATSMAYMFNSCSSLKALDLSPLDMSKVTNLTGIFYNCSALTGITPPATGAAAATELSYMFDGCSSLASADLSWLDGTKPGSMSSMFNACSSLTSLDLSGIDLSGLEEYGFTDVFSGCSSLTSVTLPTLDSTINGSITTYENLFSGCSSLESIDLSNFSPDNGGAATYSYMFQDCAALTSLDLSTFHQSGSRYNPMGSMFDGCSSLDHVVFGEYFKIFSGSYIFDGCTSLKYLVLKCPTMVTTSSVSFWNSSSTDMQPEAYVDGTFKIYVPADLVSTYKANSFWKKYTIDSIANAPAS